MKVKKSSGTVMLCGIIFLVTGLIMLAVGISIFAESRSFEANALTTTAVITEIDTYTSKSGKKTKVHHDVYVEYTVERKKYNEKLDYYVAGMHEGQEIEIFYNPSAPSDIRGGGSMQVMVICITGGMGLVFASLGGFLTIKAAKQKCGRKQLIQSGTKLTGTIINVVTDTSLRVNGQYASKAECEVIDPATGETYLYSSDGVMNDLYGFIGASVDVYVDPADKSKSYIDLETIQIATTDGAQIHDFR